jgi:hypothetical protein
MHGNTDYQALVLLVEPSGCCMHCGASNCINIMCAHMTAHKLEASGFLGTQKDCRAL